MSQLRIIKGARGRITGKFGAVNQANSHVRVHKGTDLGHGEGKPADLEVFAPGTGRVIAVGWDGTYGLRVIIDLGGGYTMLLAHLDECFVAVGAIVSVGDVIARMGNSGTIFVHLHMELRLWGVPIDCEPYFASLASFTPTPLAPPTDQEEEEMPSGYYLKGHKDPATFFVDGRTGKRRKVYLGELRAAVELNTLTKGASMTGHVTTVDQSILDEIPMS